MRHPRYLYLSASALIRRTTGASLHDLRTASVEKLLDNQRILHDAVEAELATKSRLDFILDGQCVLDNGRSIVVLTTGFIASFRPTGLILLESPADEVEKRRSTDKRERPFRTVSEINDQINLNRDAVTRYASELAIPFEIANADGPSILDPAMQKVSGSL
jgi:adenylate kinase